MMISPNGFVNEHQDDSYEDLIKLRGELIAQLEKYESEDHNNSNIANFPSPEVKYMMNLQYLARLCNLIAKKYNSDFAMGEEN